MGEAARTSLVSPWILRAESLVHRVPQRGATRLWPLAVLLGSAAGAQDLPRVASINLCADQLVLGVADPEQIATLSWLSADPEESLLADQASGVALNYGTAEELLRFEPDIVVAGSFTNLAAVSLVRRLGYRVLIVEPATDVADIERNLRAVASAIGQSGRAESAIAAMRAALPASATAAEPVDAVVVRPGGFTIGRGSLADSLMTLAGLNNVAARQGLDRWGSLSVETLLRSEPALLILTDYRSGEASLANAYFNHPALRELLTLTSTVTVPARYWACGLPGSLESIAMMRTARTR